jgi:ribosomal protein S18 acetylase RimI-like enzyme
MSSPTTVVRTASTDGPLLRRLRIAALSDAPYAFGAKLTDVLGESPESFAATAARHAASETSTSFFLWVEGEPCGMVGAFFEQTPPRRAFVCALWIAPPYRGGSHAADLVHTACAWLRQRGAKEIFAWVADSNPGALAFYRKFGFQPTDERQRLASNIAESETLLRYGQTGDDRTDDCKPVEIGKRQP